jgi:hypothetical protein
MAFDVDLTTRENACEPVDGIGKVFLMQKTVDFTVAANQVALNKTLALFKVPAGVVVLEAGYDVTTQEANVTDVDLGVFSTAGSPVDADGLLNGGSLATAGVIRQVGSPAYALPAGYVSATDEVIALTNNDAYTIATAIVAFYALCMDCRA